MPRYNDNADRDAAPDLGDWLFAKTGQAVILAAAVAVRFLLGGLVVFKYWHWFVVPVFHPAASPGVLQCVGLTLFAAVVRERWDFPADKSAEELAAEPSFSRKLAYQLLALSVVLLAGYLSHAYVAAADPAWLSALVN